MCWVRSASRYKLLSMALCQFLPMGLISRRVIAVRYPSICLTTPQLLIVLELSSPCLNKGLCQPSTLSSIFPWNISSFDQDLILLTHWKRTVPLTWKIFKHFATKTGCWSSVCFIGVFMPIHQSQNIHNWFPFKRLFFYYVTLETSVWRGWQGTAKGKKPPMFG